MSLARGQVSDLSPTDSQDSNKIRKGEKMKTATIDDLSYEEIQTLFPKPKAKKTAKTAPKKAQKANESTLDLTWTLIVTLGRLVGRGLGWCGKHIVGLTATAFLIENLLFLQHATHFVFK